MKSQTGQMPQELIDILEETDIVNLENDINQMGNAMAIEIIKSKDFFMILF